MKSKMFFQLVAILIIMLLGLACDNPEPQRPKHTYRGEPCDISIELPSICSSSEALCALATDNLSVSFTKPSWLSFSTFPLGTMSVTPTQQDVFEPFTSTVTVYSGIQTCAQMNVQFTLQSLIDGYLSSAIEQIPDEAFDTNDPQRREVFLNKLQAAMQAFSTGNVNGARQKLENDIMAKCDGDDGGNAQNDWVADHFWKQSLYGALSKIDQILMAIES